MQTERRKEGRRPAGNLTRPQLTTVTLYLQARESPDHVRLELPEFESGVTGAEVPAPAAEHGIELRDKVAHVPVTHGMRRERLHTLSNPPPRPRRRPPLEEVQPAMLLTQIGPLRRLRR